jgi:hypothetical protein
VGIFDPQYESQLSEDGETLPVLTALVKHEQEIRHLNSIVCESYPPLGQVGRLAATQSSRAIEELESAHEQT